MSHTHQITSPTDVLDVIERYTNRPIPDFVRLAIYNSIEEYAALEVQKALEKAAAERNHGSVFIKD